MNFRQGVVDITVGRRPMGDWDQLVQDWRAASGEVTRQEYLAAMHAGA